MKLVLLLLLALCGVAGAQDVGQEEIDQALGGMGSSFLRWQEEASEPTFVRWWRRDLVRHQSAQDSAWSECQEEGRVRTDVGPTYSRLAQTALAITRSLEELPEYEQWSAHLWNVVVMVETYDAAREPCTTPTVPPPNFIVQPGGSIDGVYGNASWGDVIEVDGAVGRFRMDDEKYTGSPQTPIIIRGGSDGGMISMNPSGGSSSIAMKDRGAAYTQFHDLLIQADDTASILTNAPKQAGWTYPGVEFHRCRIAVNGWDWETNTGFRNKWAFLTYGTKDWVLADCEIIGVQREHAWYSHNHQGDHFFLRCVLGNLGRCGGQWACRHAEGKPGVGKIYYYACLIFDACLQPGGGGSALSFNGGAPTGSIFLIGTTVLLGANPDLHPIGQPNITGGLVVHQGEHTEDYGGNGTVYIEQCHFQVGPHFLGEGSARRPNLKFQENIESVTIVGSSVHQYVGAQNALTISPEGWVNEGVHGQRYPAEIKQITLDTGNDIRGHCTFGSMDFKDRDEDGDGLYDGIAYREMLAALDGHPRVTIIDWDGTKLEVPEWFGEEKLPFHPVTEPEPGEPAPEPEPEPEIPDEWTPADLDGVWAWWHAGTNGSNLDLTSGRDRYINRIRDASPAGNDALATGSKPGYRQGLELGSGAKGGSYSTVRGLIGVDKWESGKQHYGNQYRFSGFPGAGEFHIAVVAWNTRVGGDRELLGDDSSNYLQVDQQSNQAHVWVAGEKFDIGSVPAGVFVLEFWRDGGLLVARVDGGEDRVLGTSSAVFDLRGLGFKGKGTSQWDDYLGEVVISEGNPPRALDGTLAQWLQGRW